DLPTQVFEHSLGARGRREPARCSAAERFAQRPAERAGGAGPGRRREGAERLRWDKQPRGSSFEVDKAVRKVKRDSLRRIEPNVGHERLAPTTNGPRGGPAEVRRSRKVI